jgi:hypothetical protein
MTKGDDGLRAVVQAQRRGGRAVAFLFLGLLLPLVVSGLLAGVDQEWIPKPARSTWQMCAGLWLCSHVGISFWLLLKEWLFGRTPPTHPDGHSATILFRRILWFLPFCGMAAIYAWSLVTMLVLYMRHSGQ